MIRIVRDIVNSEIYKRLVNCSIYLNYKEILEVKSHAMNDITEIGLLETHRRLVI